MSVAILGPGLEQVRAGSGKRRAGCAVVVLRDQRGDLQYLGNECGGGVLVAVVRPVATGCSQSALPGACPGGGASRACRAAGAVGGPLGVSDGLVGEVGDAALEGLGAGEAQGF